MKKKRIIISMICTTILPFQLKADDTVTNLMTDCNGKCQWTYNATTQELKVSTIGNQEGDVKITELYGRIGNLPVKKLVVGDGITGISKSGSYWWGINGATLVLPKTWKDTSIINGFSHLDLSALTVSNFYLGTGSALKSVIVSEDTAGSAGIQARWGAVENLIVYCKGDKNKCKTIVKNSCDACATPVSYDYYVGRDDKGHIIEEWDENGKKTYSYTYTNNGDYKMYDGEGNFLGSFMANGQKRRIYNVDEAIAVVSGNKNSFSIRYR